MSDASPAAPAAAALVAAAKPKQKTIYRYYRCEYCSAHRTAVETSTGVYDTATGLSFWTLAVWIEAYDLECFNHGNCRPLLVENGYSKVDARERIERKIAAFEKRQKMKRARQEIQRERIEKKNAAIQKRLEIQREATAFLNVVARCEASIREKEARKVAQEAWIDAKENWGVEQAEKKIAKEAKKQAKQAADA